MYYTKCNNHTDSPFLFYCFDDQIYICEKCFREHKSHKVEIKSDFKKVSDFIQLLNKSEITNLKYIYETIEKSLNSLKEEIEKLLSEVQKLSKNEELKTPGDIYNLKYEEFESYFNCLNIRSKVKDISSKGMLILNKIENYLYTKIINKEVSLFKNSNIYSDYYDNKEHFLIVDLNKELYLNSIRVRVTPDYWSLKNFIVFIKETNDKNEDWLKVNNFIKNSENQYQSFDIGYFCSQVKFVFSDALGTNSNNYILIDFEIVE